MALPFPIPSTTCRNDRHVPGAYVLSQAKPRAESARRLIAGLHRRRYAPSSLFRGPRHPVRRTGKRRVAPRRRADVAPPPRRGGPCRGPHVKRRAARCSTAAPLSRRTHRRNTPPTPARPAPHPAGIQAGWHDPARPPMGIDCGADVQTLIPASSKRRISSNSVRASPAGGLTPPLPSPCTPTNDGTPGDRHVGRPRPRPPPGTTPGGITDHATGNVTPNDNGLPRPSRTHREPTAGPGSAAHQTTVHLHLPAGPSRDRRRTYSVNPWSARTFPQFGRGAGAKIPRVGRTCTRRRSRKRLLQHGRTMRQKRAPNPWPPPCERRLACGPSRPRMV